MKNFTTQTYQLKREIVNFANKISTGTNRPTVKFVADMITGIVSSGSVLLSEISRSLKEENRLINTIDRLSRNLSNGKSFDLEENYRKIVSQMLPDEPVIMIDDTDIQKKYGKEFEALGLVIDGSSEDKKLGSGYYNTEIVALTSHNQPISLFSHIHSSTQKNYSSANTITYYGIDQAIKVLGERKATFVMDRGYDANGMFNYIMDTEHNFIIRVKSNRKFFLKNKWYSAKTLCNSRKGKLKTNLKFRDKNGKEMCVECYISHLNVKITANKHKMKLILVYGLSDTPMMLVTNRQIKGKDDAVNIARTYMSRWRIEEYFRFKKEEYDFEKYRVRSLKSMNCLNQLLGYAITFIGMMELKKETSRLRQDILSEAKTLRTDVYFYYYQFAKGIKYILQYAHTGIRHWYKSKRKIDYQISMKLIS